MLASRGTPSFPRKRPATRATRHYIALPRVKVSLVIPSLNQGAYLDAAIRSVLDQDGCDIELIVKDGGSTDNSREILRSFGDRLRWTSAPDRGQTDAINQGLREATGDIVGYLNSDDLLRPGALATVAQHFAVHPASRILYGDAHHLHADGTFLENYPTRAWNYDRLLERCFICQPATFWRRSLHAEFGYFDETFDFAMDYEFWLRLGHTLKFHHLPGQVLAGSRLHPETKTLRDRVPAHRDSLRAVLRHARKPEPVYLWLRKLARYRTSAAGFSADEFPPTRPEHHRAFVAAVLADAAELGIELPLAFRRQLERPPRPAGWLTAPLRETLQRIGTATWRRPHSAPRTGPENHGKQST